MRVRNGKLTPEPKAANGPKPVVKTVRITREEMESVARRQAEANAAAGLLNAVLEGILARHGPGNKQVTGFDAERRTITFETLPVVMPDPTRRA